MKDIKKDHEITIDYNIHYPSLFLSTKTKKKNVQKRQKIKSKKKLNKKKNIKLFKKKNIKLFKKKEY